MTKLELIEAVQKEVGEEVSKATIGRILDSFSDISKKALIEGEDVPLMDLGKLKVVQRKARKGCNPRTREKVDIPASLAVKFTCKKALKEALNPF